MQYVFTTQYGFSSLLFFIPLIHSFIHNGYIFYTGSLLGLIFASFICNATHFSQPWLFFDYLAIFCVCISSLSKHFTISYIMIMSLVGEYIILHNIENTKNLIFCIAVINSIVNSYYVNYMNLYTSSISTLNAIVIYIIRLEVAQQNTSTLHVNNYELFFLTWLFHLSIMTILYITSINLSIM